MKEEMNIMLKDYEINLYKRLKNTDVKFFIGVDEAGRGSLAGPVTVCACLLLNSFDVKGINDSKKISAKKREDLFKLLTKSDDIRYKIVNESHKVIDKINILEATMLAMSKSVKKLIKSIKNEGLIKDLKEVYILIDGNTWPKYLDRDKYFGETVIKGDGKCTSIGAASILAKVSRDADMCKLSKLKKYMFWEFDKNKGYYCNGHGEKIKDWGFGSDIHRLTFNPLKSILEEQKNVKYIVSFDEN